MYFFRNKVRGGAPGRRVPRAARKGRPRSEKPSPHCRTDVRRSPRPRKIRRPARRPPALRDTGRKKASALPCSPRTSPKVPFRRRSAARGRELLSERAQVRPAFGAGDVKIFFPPFQKQILGDAGFFRGEFGKRVEIRHRIHGRMKHRPTGNPRAVQKGKDLFPVHGVTGGFCRSISLRPRGSWRFCGRAVPRPYIRW